MYRVIVFPLANRRLKELKIEHQQAVLEALSELADDPYVGKPLSRELSGKRSYRVGVFRIIYRVYESSKTVKVFSAGHRSTIYN